MPPRRLFKSRRLSGMAASAIKKDLEGFRGVVLARRPVEAIVGVLWIGVSWWLKWFCGVEVGGRSW